MCFFFLLFVFGLDSCFACLILVYDVRARLPVSSRVSVCVCHFTILCAPFVIRLHFIDDSFAIRILHTGVAKEVAVYKTMWGSFQVNALLFCFFSVISFLCMHLALLFSCHTHHKGSILSTYG